MTEFNFKEAELMNPRNGRPYLLIPGERIERTPKFADDIADVCNESQIYDLLFKQRLKGEKYSPEEGLNFIDWIHHGWQKNTHFVFFVLSDDGDIVGCCDIKSNNLNEAEVGYWLSQKHSGIMTPAVLEMSKQALQTGFKKLVAYTIAENQTSQRVLERCSYHFDGAVTKSDKTMNRYSLERKN